MTKPLTYGSLFSGTECMSAAAIGLPLVPRFFAEVEPYPCAILRSKFPGVPNLGDVTKIKYDAETKTLSNGRDSVDLSQGLDILAGGSPCFVAGTLVLTPSGYRPIEDLKVGDEVVGGKTGEIRRVEAVGSKVAPVGRIKVLGRPPITCTHDHPFYCIDMKRDGCSKSATYGKILPQGDYAKVHAKDAVGKYAGRVKIPDVLTEHATPKVGSLTHAEVLNLAGWYVGDGCIHRWKGKSKKSVMLALYSAKKIGKFRSLYDGKVSFYITADGKVEVYGTAFADWLIANFGEHSTDKTVPYWLYSDSAKQDFLLGYLATDGCTIGTMRQFVSVSPRLAYGVADLIGSAAVSVRRVPPKGVIKGREVNQHDGFTVRWHRQSAKTKLIHGRYASIVRNFKNDGTTTARVFNITVSEEHTYVVEGVCCFNCQDFSVAGKRAGADSELLNDGGTTRSSLIFTYIRLLREIRPKWIIYENVPGLLTSNEGRDFAHFLVALAQCGYGDFAWRVLDAQYVRVDGMERAVPQRRRRVWLVGRLGENDGRAAEVLLEPYGNPGDFPPRRKTGEEVARSLAARAGVHGGMVEGARRGDGDGRVCATVENHKSGSRVFETSVAATMGASRNANASNDNPLVIEGECIGFKSKPSEKARSLGIEREVSPCLSSATHDASAVVPNGKASHVVAIDMDKNKPGNADKPDRKGGAGFGVSEKGVSYTLTATDQHAVCYDGYNQSASEEVCMTIRSAATGAEGNDADPKVCVSRSYGMNPQNGSQMFPCTEEVGQTLAVQHQGGVIHRTESESNCLTPGDPLTKRVYTSDGVAPTMMSIAKNSGISTQSFVLPPQTDETIPEIVVRRLTPTECERLMGLPQQQYLRISDMNNDEFVAWELAKGNISVDAERGIVYSNRRAQGIPCEPHELKGTIIRGYRHLKIVDGKIRRAVRHHRVIWIAAHGIPPEGMVVDHINNDKSDNRISNLQLLTPEDNSHKAREDGLYLTGENSPATKLSDCEVVEVLLTYQLGHTFREVARMFGISKSRVHQLVHQYGWTQVRFTKEQIADPEIVAYFRRVHDDWQKMNAGGGKTPKPKTEKFVIDWLTRISDPENCPDAPRYKVCGNGMCANQVRWILLNLLRSEGIDPWYPEDGETDGKRQKRKGK